MTIPRKEIIRDNQEGLYHCISRCVRRAFLCGFDELTGLDFEHRKVWIESRLIFLASVFAIDVAAAAILSNHLHLILRNRPDIAGSWSDHEVAKRWRMLYPKGSTEKERELAIRALSRDKETIKKYRERLQSISWFMKSINEYIAKRANKEDQCKGSFWDGRFKSIELADEAALLACMIYVDLNPIRAGVASTPERSDFTSIQKRIIGKRARDRLASIGSNQPVDKKTKSAAILREVERSNMDKWLSPISTSDNGQKRGLLPISESDYIRLVDYSGRELQTGKPGLIPQDLAPILTRLDIDLENWTTTITKFDSLFCRTAGRFKSLVETARRVQKCWLKGFQASRMAFVC